MQIIHTISELRTALKNQVSIAFVPTMGNLHAGHIKLVEMAKQHATCVVVSIFVNPLQFGKNEDLASYPRTLEADCDKLKQIGANFVFAPNVQEMYPDFDGNDLNQSMTITPSIIASELCGAVRPGHFAGVATVVMKLFNIVQPNVAVFGKKDYQQLFIIRELVRQFNLNVEIIGVDTMREVDGLAMSSRNGYLTPMQRGEAPRLHKALKLVAEAIQKGNRDFTAIEQQTTQFLTQLGWIVDYISIRSAKTLLSPNAHDHTLIVLGAAKLGSTRLIDNLEIPS
ncbi:MAG TPA: pantoate--beta-alanine ligase [Methylophilaceae bacterium]|jgi:pantoate--beta-alanine ligase